METVLMFIPGKYHSPDSEPDSTTKVIVCQVCNGKFIVPIAEEYLPVCDYSSCKDAYAKQQAADAINTDVYSKENASSDDVIAKAIGS